MKFFIYTLLLLANTVGVSQIVKEKNRFGYVCLEINGREVTKLGEYDDFRELDSIGELSKFILAERNGYYFLFNSNSRLISKDSFTDFPSSFYSVIFTEKFNQSSFFDKSGNFLFSKWNLEVFSHNYNKLVLNYNNLYACLLSERLIIDSVKYPIDYFDEKVYKYKKGNKFGLNYVNHKVAIPADYLSINRIIEDVNIVKTEQRKFGILKDNGVTILNPFLADTLYSIENGKGDFFIKRVNKIYQLINLKGEIKRNNISPNAKIVYFNNGYLLFDNKAYSFNLDFELIDEADSYYIETNNGLLRYDNFGSGAEIKFKLNENLQFTKSAIKKIVYIQNDSVFICELQNGNLGIFNNAHLVKTDFVKVDQVTLCNQGLNCADLQKRVFYILEGNGKKHLYNNKLIFQLALDTFFISDSNWKTYKNNRIDKSHILDHENNRIISVSHSFHMMNNGNILTHWDDGYRLHKSNGDSIYLGIYKHGFLESNSLILKKQIIINDKEVTETIWQKIYPYELIKKDTVQIFSGQNGAYKFYVNKEYGLLDTFGKVIVKPKFDLINLNTSYADLIKGDKYGFYWYSTKKIMEPEKNYSYFPFIDPNFAIVSKELYKNGLCDNNKKILIPMIYLGIKIEFHNKRKVYKCIKENGKFDYYDQGFKRINKFQITSN